MSKKKIILIGSVFILCCFLLAVYVLSAQAPSKFINADKEMQQRCGDIFAELHTVNLACDKYRENQRVELKKLCEIAIHKIDPVCIRFKHYSGVQESNKEIRERMGVGSWIPDKE